MRGKPKVDKPYMSKIVRADGKKEISNNIPSEMRKCRHDWVRVNKDSSSICDDCGEQFPPVTKSKKKNDNGK